MTPLTAPLRLFLVLALTAVLAGCASPVRDLRDTGAPPRFDAYQQRTWAQLQTRRAFQTDDPAAEVRWNGPREWLPDPDPTRPRRGVLLVHGLGDSPWSFHDLGATLAEQGFVARTVLLPGHGTTPEDLLEVSLADWQRTVQEQVTALREDVDEVWLGGFSTGANLILDVAYDDAAIAGLLLFSPGFRADSGYAWLTPWISWARPWLAPPNPARPLQNAVRYLNTPTNGFAQFYRSSHAAQRRLASKPYDKPVFMVVAEHDSVLDTAYLLDVFQTRLRHPDSRMVWYGAAPESADPRIVVRADYRPELRISQFSHMGMLFSPDNPLYGTSGSLRLCWNGQPDPARRACEQGAPVWYSDWGYQEPEKIHARLTFNPDYAWQAGVMAEVMQARRAPGDGPYGALAN